MSTEQSFLLNIAQVARELGTYFDAQLKGMGLTAARGRVLLLLARNPQGVSQAGVTDFMRVEHPTAVRILDGLEALGHIKRLPAPNDRRAKVIVLTEAGRPLADQVVVLTERLNTVLMEGLDRADVVKANGLIDALLTNLATLKAAGAPETASDEADQ